MARLTLWLIVLAIESSIASKHRSVNLALETVVEFDKLDDVKVVNRVQDFLTRVQSLLNKNHRSDLSTRRKNLYQFSDFLEDVIIEVQSLDDDDLLEIFNIVKKNVEKRKKNDILDDNGRRYLSGKLSVLRQRPTVEIRSDLDELLRELRNDRQSKSNYILGFINKLYERDAQNKLKKFVKRLNIFRRSARKSKVDLKNIIEKVINDVIYEHYNNLEGDERRYIKKYVRSFFVEDAPKEVTTKPATDEEKTENVNTDEESSESVEQAVDVSPFADNTKQNTKPNNLYPKTSKVTSTQKHKFRTGIPVREHQLEEVADKPTEEDRGEESGQTFKAQDVIATREIFANHSLEINVNLMIKKHKDSQEENVPNQNTYKHRLSQRASTKKTRKPKNHRTTTAALSAETFGSLHKKTTKKHITKKKLRAPKTRTTAKEAILRTMMNVDTDEKDSEPLSDDNRRKNFKNIHTEDHKSVKTTMKQAIRRANIPIESYYNVTLTTRVNSVSVPTMRKHRTTTTSRPVVTTTEDTTSSPTTTVTTTTTTTPSDIFNEIQHKNVTDAELSSEIDNLDVNHPEDTNLTDSNKTIGNETETFNIDEYLKKSDLRNAVNEDKMKNIEDTMRDDFKMLMSSPATTTTEAFTDVFKELEDAFEI
ncbi:hypothetical protein KGM_203359 [Danaus plexippus plexippus]|uniref:Uncharacterized protein n=1 Tax=Danaus plexippus plexippus TaxID=278856 RepID=A0A212FJ81_DANPL|nr:hypothetical protein KGM_203359 [Danaus plexippus plexippus]